MTDRWLPGRDTRAERHPGPGGKPRAAGQKVVVAGGGIAGLAAATTLAERGARVIVIEPQHELGGRARSWDTTLANGDVTTMSRGFHAFFRQYYNLRQLLRRADPTLAALRPVGDYPLDLAGGPRDSFANIPRQPPFNLMGFVAQSPSFPLRALAEVDVDRAMGLLDVEFPQTFSDYDGISAADVLDRLRFPDSARHLALEVFARSFFADPREFSGGELVAMFHTYFVGSAEGLLFDVAADDFTSALWNPLAEYLTQRGVELRTGTAIVSVDASESHLTIHTDAADIRADALVLAPHLHGLRGIVADSPSLDDAWRKQIAGLRSAPPFAVWRRWLDRRPAPETPDFLGTSGYGPLDNVSMIHHFERSATDWAERHRGSVVELHAYAIDPGADHDALKAELAVQQDRIHPELAPAGSLGEEWIVADDCGLIDTSPWAERPGVTTPDPRITLAGDAIRCDYPVALMERAATTGVLAANALLGAWGVAGDEVWTAPTKPRFGWIRPARGLLNRLPLPSRVSGS